MVRPAIYSPSGYVQPTLKPTLAGPNGLPVHENDSPNPPRSQLLIPEVEVHPPLQLAPLLIPIRLLLLLSLDCRQLLRRRRRRLDRPPDRKRHPPRLLIQLQN